MPSFRDLPNPGIALYLSMSAGFTSPTLLNGFPWWLWLKKKKMCLPMQDMQDTRVGSLCREDPLEEDMATHSSILAQKISWTEEAQAGYSPWGRKGAGHDLATEQVF